LSSNCKEMYCESSCNAGEDCILGNIEEVYMGGNDCLDVEVGVSTRAGVGVDSVRLLIGDSAECRFLAKALVNSDLCVVLRTSGLVMLTFGIKGECDGVFCIFGSMAAKKGENG
jgi:hypothetical protein